MAELNITNIPAPRVPFIDERTGLMAREWYRFFLNLFVLTGSGNNPITLEELQLGPPNQPDLAELLIQINQNIAPQYEDQSGDFLATLDTAQLMSMMARFENAEAAIQGAYLQPVVQTGTIANYNLDNSPTAGGIVYGTGPALAVSAAGTLGQVLTSAGAGTPTWAAAAAGTVSSVSVVSANGLAGTVATATTTPAITLSTTITGLLKGNGTAISAATSGTDYAPATSGTSILYGNGAGGFSNVTIGTGVAFTAGTLSATGSGGTVTSVAQSFTGGLISVAGSPITTSGTLALTVAGTSGGIPYFSSATTWATSAALAAGSLVQGGGAGVAPSTITTGTGVVTALGVNTGTAGAFVVNGGALGTPSSGTVTNLTGTASININGTVGATTATTGKFTTITTSSTINSLTVGLGGGSVAGNTVLGTSAFVSNVTGGYSVAIGTQALQVSTAGYNTAVGNISQQLTSTGQSNVSMGYGSLAANTSGGSNTAIGTFALYVNTGSSNSTAVGYQAGIASTGASNQFFGNSSGSSVTSGAQNVILGGYTGAAAPISATGSNYVVLSDGVGNVRGYWNGADATFNGPLNTTGSISKNSTVIRGTLNIGRNSATIAASTTNYLSTRSGETTEALGQMVISSATTLRNLYIATSTTQGALGSLVVTIRKNGAATALTVTIAAGTAAGVFSDTTHSVTFAAGDLISAQAVNNDLVNVSAIIQSVSVAQDIG